MFSFFVSLIEKIRESEMKTDNFVIKLYRRKMKTRVTLTLLFLFIGLYSQLNATFSNSDDSPYRLFHIARSKNANLVCYDVNLKGNNPDEDSPIHVYWINRTDHPGERSELNYIQRTMAYGYSSKKFSDGSFEVSLVAFPERKLIVIKDGKVWRSRIIINGKLAWLQKIFVQAKPDSFMKVAWVELTGVDIKTGSALTERIIQK
mgnify:FL=1